MKSFDFEGRLAPMLKLNQHLYDLPFIGTLQAHIHSEQKKIKRNRIRCVYKRSRPYKQDYVCRRPSQHQLNLREGQLKHRMSANLPLRFSHLASTILCLLLVLPYAYSLGTSCSGPLGAGNASPSDPYWLQTLPTRSLLILPFISNMISAHNLQRNVGL